MKKQTKRRCINCEYMDCAASVGNNMPGRYSFVTFLYDTQSNCIYKILTELGTERRILWIKHFVIQKTRSK